MYYSCSNYFWAKFLISLKLKLLSGTADDEAFWTVFNGITGQFIATVGGYR